MKIMNPPQIVPIWIFLLREEDSKLILYYHLIFFAGIHTWLCYCRPWPDVDTSSLRMCTCQRLKRNTCRTTPAARRAGRPRPLRPPCPRSPGHGSTVKISWTVAESITSISHIDHYFMNIFIIYPMLLWIFFSVVCICILKLLWPKMVQVAKVGDCKRRVGCVSYQDDNQLNEFSLIQCFIYLKFVQC